MPTDIFFTFSFSLLTDLVFFFSSFIDIQLTYDLVFFLIQTFHCGAWRNYHTLLNIATSTWVHTVIGAALSAAANSFFF